MLIKQFTGSFLFCPVAENKTREMVFICWDFFFCFIIIFV